ncbi:MAG: S9 family peptidase [Acidobacteria bacterium]|nr:S9 family peptidase [Acidobacteriota bacterium]
MIRDRLLLFAAALLVLVPTLAVHAAEVERVEKGNLVIEGIPDIPADVEARLQRYENARSASFQGWLPDGSGVLISTRFAETSQIHRVDQPGGARQQLTFFDEPVGGAAPSPKADDPVFLFTKDVGGAEFFQVFSYDLETGRYRLLTDGSSLNGSVTWAHDGKHFAYYTTRRNGRDWDVYLGDVDRPEDARVLLEKGGAWVVGGFSPDDSKLIVVRYISANETDPYILDIASGELSAIDDTEEPVAYSAMKFSADGKGLYYASDEGTEFKHLRYLDLATGERTTLTADIPWDVESLAVSDDGHYLGFTVNEDGIARLHVRDLTEAGAEIALPELPDGLIYGLDFDPASRRLGMTINTPQTPGDVFSLDLATKRLDRWTYSEVGGLSTDEMVAPELIRFPTFDSVDGKPRLIPAFYYRPAGKGPFPVVVDIHGGPEGQERPSFSPFIQFLVRELGVAVLAPNVRGSAGYGKSYLLLDNGMKREDSVQDIGKLLDWAAARPELDGDRMGVFGGSYGGYMVLASMVHFHDRLRAGVDVVGISNFVTFLENTQDYRRDLRRAEYGDERDPEMRTFLEKVSPMTHAAQITDPLLVVQGLNDPRVPVTESEQMVDVIRGNGGEVWYLLAKDEGHGFRKKVNRDYFLASTALFFERYLVGSVQTGDAEEGPASKP